MLTFKPPSKFSSQLALRTHSTKQVKKYMQQYIQ
uniref:Uncharacterized protein n=1 Tax=Rhizophora mucronata TaxID=61149 RepID=A0A2P2JM37_RHIMU